ncbi:hypothetical protein HK100_008684 [Physocladia obscura]|uniref:Phosphate-induced protein 1 conserved region-domain-containing protein n=1 Tax=Physocladia obscura TaxID=109957 RepID=A0AAD5XAH8_9FUNG|nr:hypothetical protein HK100_008684 [Physocladia obscura]
MLFSLVLAATAAFAAPVERDTPLPTGVNFQLLNGAKNGVSANIVNLAAAASANTLKYYGGPVISNVTVQPLWYSSAPTYASNILTFYSAVTDSAWIQLLTQYNEAAYPGTLGSGTSASTAITIAAGSANPATVDDSAIQSLLKNLVAAGSIVPTAHTYFPIHFPSGYTVTSSGEASCVVFCAYHGTVDISSTSNNNGQTYLYYGVIPDQGGSCAGGCGSNSQTVNNLFSVSSHELAEAITDPAVGVATTYASPLAWYNTNNGEIGDICNAEQSTTVGRDGVTYVIQKLWSNSAKSCVAK